MTAALNVADQGFRAVIVEREARLGGLLLGLETVCHDRQEVPAAEVVAAMEARVEAHPDITVHLSTDIESVEGYIGNYKVALKPAGDEEGGAEVLDISTIVVATGMQEIEPVGFYEYGTDPRVVTQLQLESLIKTGEVKKYRDVVVINCVDSRNDHRGCCNIGCFVSVKNALAVKAAGEDVRVHVLYRDMSMLKEEPAHVEDAKRAGVRFIRFSDDRYPRLERKGDCLEIRVNDVLLGRDLAIPADLVVLTTGFRGNDTVEKIKGLLKVSASADGFFQEAHIKLGPLDFSSDGLALCGCARSPKMLKETCEEGIGAAMRVSIPMKNGYIEAAGIVADIDLADCKLCGMCARNCPYSAIQVNDAKEPSVIKALCKGCGLCVADCPTNSITLVHYTDDQLQAQVEAALEEKAGDKILGFVCHWCALGGVDMAGVSRLQYPTNARLIRVMCSARVPIRLIMRAFELGAGGVLVAGCEFPTCHYITGNYACETRMKRARKKLQKSGYDPDRLWNVWCSAADGPKFAKTMRDMVKTLGLERGVKANG